MDKLIYVAKTDRIELNLNEPILDLLHFCDSFQICGNLHIVGISQLVRIMLMLGSHKNCRTSFAVWKKTVNDVRHPLLTFKCIWIFLFFLLVLKRHWTSFWKRNTLPFSTGLLLCLPSNASRLLTFNNL
jgi:hypothetical protein